MATKWPDPLTGIQYNLKVLVLLDQVSGSRPPHSYGITTVSTNTWDLINIAEYVTTHDWILSPDGKFISYEQYSNLYSRKNVIEDIEAGEVLRSFEGTDYDLYEFSPDGNWLYMEDHDSLFYRDISDLHQ